MKSGTALILAVILLAFNTTGFAKDDSSDVLSYYPYVMEVHHGPIQWHKDTSNPYDMGVTYRAVIIKQEGHYGLIIETLKVSDEGGLEFIKSDFVNFEMSSDQFTFESWLKPNIVQVKQGNKSYKVLINRDGKASISAQ